MTFTGHKTVVHLMALNLDISSYGDPECSLSFFLTSTEGKYTINRSFFKMHELTLQNLFKAIDGFLKIRGIQYA